MAQQQPSTSTSFKIPSRASQGNRNRGGGGSHGQCRPSPSPSSSNNNNQNNLSPCPVANIQGSLNQLQLRPRKEQAALTVLRKIPGFSDSSLYMCRLITATDPEYDLIYNYIRNSQNHGFRMYIKNIIRVIRKNDFEFDHDPTKARRFRLILWHGTGPNSVAKILRDGFRTPRPNGQMFGTGIYFADRASKSARYCTNDAGRTCGAQPRRGSVGYLLLCDVLVGKSFNAKNGQSSLTAPISGFDSVKCTGGKVPDRHEQVELGGAIWPIGKTIQNTEFPTYTVRFNEYSIYDPKNIKVKYVVEIEMQ